MPQVEGIVQTNPVNTTEGRHNRSFSTFDKSLSYRLYNTLRFGDYTPTFEMEGVPTDDISLNSNDIIDSLSLNAPFKGQIRKIKESFSVPNMAILPHNWDLVYTQPTQGDDVPKDANCVISDFPEKMKSFWMSARNIIYIYSSNVNPDDLSTWNQFLTALIRTLILGEYVYSNGSLLHVSGYKAAGQFNFWHDLVDRWSYDMYFDAVITSVFKYVKSFQISYYVGSELKHLRFKGLSGEDSTFQYSASFRSFLEFARENPVFGFDTVNMSSYFVDEVAIGLDGLAQDIATDYFGESLFFFVLPEESIDEEDLTSVSQKNLNLSRILAYQLVCAHFYTNSSLDPIYTAELYRQYILRMCDPYVGSSEYGFSYNGFINRYDALSGHILARGLFNGSDTTTPEIGGVEQMITYMPSDDSHAKNFWAVWSAVFGFRKSLRYGDYFVGSRPRPLAPVNTDVSVDNNKVSVINITRNIQAQRFANAVMRSRSKIEEYVNSLFGKSPAPDFHNPFYLTRQVEMIFGDEVQNTAESQVSNPNSRTANFATGMNDFTFTFHNDDAHPCIYLQIVSFDIRRAYTRSVDRQFLHADRYDMFNPDFQYIGDQPVYGIELGYAGDSSSIPEVFAYQTRDAEYKERFDVASGGFVENLPGWILTDRDRFHNEVSNIDSDFIRSYNTELDQFFLSLTGFSLGSYFHFVCITNNLVSARRPMAVDPQILG